MAGQRQRGGSGGGGSISRQETTNNSQSRTIRANGMWTAVGCGLCFFKFRQQTRITFLEREKRRRKEQFGVDYSNLLLAAQRNKSSSKVAERRVCLKDAKRDLRKMDESIADCFDSIEAKVEEIQSASQRPAKSQTCKKNTKKKIQRDQSKRLPKRASQRNIQQNAKKQTGNNKKSSRPMSAVNLSLTPEEFQGDEVGKWTSCQWTLKEVQFDGNWTSTTKGRVEQIQGKSIERARQKFEAHPQVYIALFYPTEMLEWPEEEQQYTLIYRADTTGLKPKGVRKKGKVTFLMHYYQPLPSFNNDLLPLKFQDKLTSSMTYQGQKLVTKARKALLPGRGMDLVDDPTIKIIGEVNPSDIAQGQCGNCWLLSGIASLAEFDGAVRRLFRKTPNLDQMPFVDGRANVYTITLWDLRTWKEVDIVVDERLPIRADGSGRLFGAKPSDDGELWVCYLEKALAAHCGGWDLIDGGQCTHAWALLTGCKEQYIIQRSMSDPDRFICTAKFNMELDQWADHENSPSLGDQGMWEVPWPKIGGAGTDALDEEELYCRMCLWNDTNYLVGASTKGASDENMTDGIVDNHAYSVIDCQNDVCGTGMDMILIRNPWGKGEIERGHFGSHGPGWKEYPQIEKALEPIHDADDGVFWMTKEEFFEHFEAVYLGASDLTKFLLDGMRMSKHSRHRLSKHNSKQSTNHKALRLSTHSSHHSTDLDSIDSIA